MLFTAVRSQEFVSLTVVSDGVWWTKGWWPAHYPIQGSGCEGIREEVTCDAGSLEAVTWQPVGGAVYMQNAAINSVKCLPEPQIRRQDCYHRLKSFQSASMEIQNGSLVGLFDPLACREVFILWMSWKHTHTHTHTHAACVKIVGKAKWWQMTRGSVVRVTRCPSCPDLWGAAGCLTSKRDNQGSSGRGDTHGWQKRSSTTPASPQSSSIFNIFLQKTSFKSSFTVSKLSTQVTFSAVLNTGQLKITPKRLYQHMGLT